MALQLKSPAEPMAYRSTDEILAYVGEYGRFQKLLTALLFVMCIPMSYPIVIMYFSSFEPSWRCATNSSVCHYNGTFENTDRRKCQMDRRDWEYTKPKSYSLVTQFDINCDEQWKVDLTRSVGFMGWGFGAVVLGWFGDKYGRRSLLIPSIVATLFVTLITPFLPSIYLVIAFRFFSCFFIPGSALSSFILIAELVGERQRALAGSLIYVTVTVGFCIIVLKAYFIEGWKMLGIVCSVPYLVVFAFYSFIPESIQWLCIQGRTDDALKIIHRIGRWNNKKLPSGITIAPPPIDALEHTTSLLDLFRTWSLAMCSIVSAYLWIVVSLAIYGLLLAANDLGGSVYVDFFIMNLACIPTTFFSIVLCQRVGRKKGTLFPAIVGGLICLIVAPIPTKGSMDLARIASAIIGEMAISTAFNSLYLWSLDLYPTSIRAKGMGWLQVQARVGSTLAPWISEWTEPLGKGAPFITIGLPLIIGVMVGLKLPETQEEVNVTDTKVNVDNGETAMTNAEV